MKTTKKNITRYVRFKLGTSKLWAVNALVKIYQENQTEEEKAKEDTIEDNGIGFTGADGQFLSSLAQHYIDKGWFSPKQMKLVYKNMPKYHGQVIQFANSDKLQSQVEAWEGQPTQQELLTA